MKNIFLCGKPGCGKTTLIIEIIKELNLNAGGFYTSEIREKGIRKGFRITTLDGKEGILAHLNVKSPYRLGKYKVNIKDLEEIGVASILEAMKENKVIITNEIGKMEMMSEKFKKAVISALDSRNKVLGVIMLKPNPFCDKIKKRADIKFFYLTSENREKIKKEIMDLLQK